MQDSALVAQLQDEQTRNAAFETLLDLYQKPLYWHIRKIVISHDDADDVLQNVFIKVFHHIQEFKGESKLFSWLYRIATNEALSHLRKESKKTQLTPEILKQQRVSSLQADVYFDGDEIQLKLQQAVARLPEKQQLVFNMHYFDNLKYSEISEILETTEGALKASYHHAVKKIESFLKER